MRTICGLNEIGRFSRSATELVAMRPQGTDLLEASENLLDWTAIQTVRRQQRSGEGHSWSVNFRRGPTKGSGAVRSYMASCSLWLSQLECSSLLRILRLSANIPFVAQAEVSMIAMMCSSVRGFQAPGAPCLLPTDRPAGSHAALTSFAYPPGRGGGAVHPSILNGSSGDAIGANPGPSLHLRSSVGAGSSPR
jgi:hypothetical protein